MHEFTCPRCQTRLPPTMTLASFSVSRDELEVRWDCDTCTWSLEILVTDVDYDSVKLELVRFLQDQRRNKFKLKVIK